MRHIALLLLLLTGCATERHRILVATSTIIGVEIAQNPQTEMYTAKLGYNRSELAMLPTNRGTKGDRAIGNGAKDCPEVLMELRYGNIFSFTEASIYQRLAVGSIAVSQPGAAFMFAKGQSGDLNAATAAAISQNIKGIPAPNPASTSALVPLAAAYAKSTDKPAFDSVAVTQGFTTFSDFLISPSLSLDKVQAMVDALNHAGLLK
jgi:hypothetical protein